jgi:hypothetical protein
MGVGVKCYVFRLTYGSGGAVTNDRTGQNLPGRPLGNWTYDGDVDVKPGGGPLIGADSDDVLASIDRRGYYLWPLKVL